MNDIIIAITGHSHAHHAMHDYISSTIICISYPITYVNDTLFQTLHLIRTHLGTIDMDNTGITITGIH